MSDHINHAARAMDPDAFADRDPQRPNAELQWAVRRKIATDHAQALDAAGLLVTPERDAEVRAETLREAAEVFAKFARAAYTEQVRVGWELAHGALLGIEREGGASS